jgi:hypothetical protein
MEMASSGFRKTFLIVLGRIRFAHFRSSICFGVAEEFEHQINVDKYFTPLRFVSTFLQIELPNRKLAFSRFSFQLQHPAYKPLPVTL